MTITASATRRRAGLAGFRQVSGGTVQGRARVRVVPLLSHNHTTSSSGCYDNEPPGVSFRADLSRATRGTHTNDDDR